MKTQKISQPTALNMFLNYTKELSKTGVSFSNMTYFVDEAKSKTVKGQKMLQKLVTLNCTIGSDYQKKVNKILLDKQGMEINFTANKMFGKHYVNNGQPVVIDDKTNSKYYLCFIVEHHTTPNTQLYKNGQKVDRSDVWNDEHITPAGLKPSKTSGRGLVANENNFYFRSLNFDNLISFKMNGCTYIIER